MNDQPLDKEPGPTTEEQKETHSNTGFYILIISILLLFIVFFGVSYYLQNKNNQANEGHTLNYNGFSFDYYLDVQIWKTQWQNNQSLYNIYFHYSPLEAEKVPIYQKNPLSKNFNADRFYVTFDPLGNNTDYFKIAVAELDLALARVFQRTPIGACAENNTPACYTRPIKNCDNTQDPVFYLKQEGDPSIILDDHCIIITGTDKELVLAVDRLLYHWYRIIKEKEPLQIIETPS